MRALLVSNMLPSTDNPALGSFVRDQYAALQRIDGLDVELHEFAPGRGSPGAYLKAGRELTQKYKGQRFDIVHAHFGLTGWAALGARADKRVLTLHGNDLHNPRSRRITLAAARRYDLLSAVSSELANLIPGAGKRRRVAILPVGVDLARFRPIARDEARSRLGLEPDGRYILFCHSPSRPDKRHDLAVALARATRSELLSLGAVVPEDVPYWHNAANAVVVPSDYEGFGLAALEALACDVPVIATPTGVHPVALDGIPGTYCAPFTLQAWSAALAPHLTASESRVPGRDRAAMFSSDQMAARVVQAWSELLERPVSSQTQ
ncbi:MAG TPA: glycosyltransferase [Baekduia sp.]|nr:glycosyltransferase [Baekduia sp.]